MAFFGLFGKKKKQDPLIKIEKPSYSGPRPYTGEQVGYGAPQLKTLADAYLPALMSRARGESGVGFDPAYRNTLRSEFLKDFGDYEGDTYAKASAQASGQGLRGGIPLSIRQNYAKSLGRARESGLADIDIRDLEARREDTNNAFYQQPQEISRGTGIQQNAANFGLNEYNATLPDYIKNPDYVPAGQGLGFLSDTIGGSFLKSGGLDTGRIDFGGVGGSGQLGKSFYQGQTGTGGNTGYNKSFYKDPNFYMDAAKIAAMFAGGCWVAAEIFENGWDDPKTHYTRYFINEISPAWFRKFYIEHGEKIADFISDKPILKSLLRPVFELFALIGELTSRRIYGCI